jgi:PAS domain S-box-containing protein
MAFEDAVRLSITTKSCKLTVRNPTDLFMRFLHRLINVGVKETNSVIVRRNIQLTNFIALCLSLAIISILTIRFLTAPFYAWFYLPLTIQVAFYLGLIALNKIGYTKLSRVLVCWIPSIALFIDFQIIITHAAVPETSQYAGFRLFQVAFSFFPFLVFNLSERWLMGIGALVPAVSVIFFDRILDLMGVGYLSMGLTESTYFYNNVRTIITLGLIASVFVFLKQILEKQELRNEKLIRELAEKNISIQRDARRELKRAYDRLKYHINNTPLAVIERDENFQITFWNKRAEELFGWTASEVLNQRPLDFLIHPDEHSVASKTMDALVADKKESSFMELRAITKTGAVRHCLWYYSFLRDEQGELETILSFVSDITEQRDANFFLKERIKELRTLYNVSTSLTTSDKSMHEVFSELPSMLPSGWQFPEVCAARLKVFDVFYQTENFSESTYRQQAKILVNGSEIGFLEVLYLEERPKSYEGPFFREEKELLVAIAGMLQVYIERKLDEEKFFKAQANLAATINNTEIIIWSVDQNFKLITYNEPFRKYALEHYSVDLDTVNNVQYFPEELLFKWRARYQRVLTGEILTLEETSGDIDFRFSLSPIIDNANVIGVSVFGDNITDRNRHERELAEANKKVTEFKIMALRSVMNPHFIFNVLSSIQYFILRNDELNAINYLTSFSKLMRTVLTRSAVDLVTVKDEIDLLNDYVHLEKLRFDDKFDFAIRCEESMEPDEIKLPSLLIQPYVENAILHGLYNKIGKGRLTIDVKTNSNFLIFEIEDNGVGRAAALEIRGRNNAHGKSMGTQLTEERLMILNSDSETPVVYTDLFNEGKPCGTRVTIRIKLYPN